MIYKQLKMFFLFFLRALFFSFSFFESVTSVIYSSHQFTQPLKKKNNQLFICFLNCNIARDAQK